MYKVTLLLSLVALLLQGSEIVAEEDSVCVDPEADCSATPELELMPGPTKVGELTMLRWANGTAVDPYAFQIGLPENVTDTLREFCQEMGMAELFRDLMGEGAYDPGDSEYVRIKGKKWYIQRPEKKWHSTSHWLNPTDEKAHEQFLRVLGEGGFDVVLEAIGRQFGLDGLTLYSVSFFVVDHSENGYMHDDFKYVGNKTFNVLIPVNLAKNSVSELYVESRDNPNVTATVKYEYDVAIGVGDYTRHATGDCDYRKSGEMRVMATLYMADIDEDNVKNIIEHYTDPFPPADEEYLLRRRGLHWKRDGSVHLPRALSPAEIDAEAIDKTLMPGPTKPGELSMLQFTDGEVLDPYAFRVGLPSNLTQALRDFCDNMGFQDVFNNLMGEGAYDPGDSGNIELKGKKWYIQRPAKKWHSNSHWLNPMDEEALDQFVRVLGDGGFDVVLEAIGRHFDLDGLQCYSPGFFVVNHCEDGWVHDDFKGVAGKGFNLLLPVILANDSTAELYIENLDDPDVNASVVYESNVGIGVGDYTKHATGDCDYRATGEMRVMATIYLADIDEDNVQNIMEHYTDPFPPAEEDYLLRRSGIHWSRDGSTHLPRGLSPIETGLIPGPKEPGELSILQFGDGTVVDPYAFRVGLPANLTKVLTDYCDEMGLTKLFQKLMGPDALGSGESKGVELNGSNWYIQRTTEVWHTTSHWLNPNDEEAHEQYLKVLQKGGFDMVLESIGRHFDLDGLACYSLGFVVLDECKQGFMYYDFKQVGGRAFNLMLPIMLVDDSMSQHYVQNSENPNVVAKVDYEYGVGIGVGDLTRHNNGDIDYRDSGGMLVAATIYLADINEANVENLIEDFTDPFPPHDEEYLLKQRGIHWNKEGSTRLPS